MDRITDRQLEAVVHAINKATGSPGMPWIKNPDGEGMKSCLGNYHLDHAYGGVSLHRVVGERGTVEDVFRCGYVPKRDLWNRMHAYLDAIYTHGAKPE